MYLIPLVALGSTPRSCSRPSFPSSTTHALHFCQVMLMPRPSRRCGRGVRCLRRPLRLSVSTLCTPLLRAGRALGGRLLLLLLGIMDRKVAGTRVLRRLWRRQWSGWKRGELCRLWLLCWWCLLLRIGGIRVLLSDGLLGLVWLMLLGVGRVRVLLGWRLRSGGLRLLVWLLVGRVLVLSWRMRLLLDRWLGCRSEWCGRVWDSGDCVSLDGRGRCRAWRRRGQAEAVGVGGLRRRWWGVLGFGGGSCGRRREVDHRSRPLVCD